jgi:hypothetical protein
VKGLVRLTLTALVLAGALLVPIAGGAAAPSPPKLPTLPDNLPGADVARFKVVVEGVAEARRSLSGDGNNGICGTQIAQGKVTEHYDYGRGKGLTIEALRFGKGKRSGVLVKRSGRKADISFEVQGKIERSAEGIYERYSVGSVPCPSLHREDFADGKDCGVAYRENEKMALTYDSRKGSVGMRQLGGLTALSKVDQCGRASDGFGVLADLPYAWPGPTTPLQGKLPVGLLFGKRKSFAVELEAPRIQKSERRNEGPIALAISDEATQTATLRFVRLGD